MKDTSFAKLVVLVNAAVPLGLLCWDAWYHHLGANPVAFALHISGKLALIFLLLSLTVTPARKIPGLNWLIHVRRLLGLYAFFYGVLHLSIYFVFDKQLNLGAVIDDVNEHRFILIGMTALMLMVPLAVTSTNGMIKRLGANRWKQLHRLAYVSAIAGVVHFYMSQKADKTTPIVFGVVLVILFGYRLAVYAQKRSKTPRPPAGVARAV